MEAAQAVQAVQENTDALSSLEERITRAVQVLTTLREENERLQRENNELQQQLQREKNDLQQRVQQLNSEVDTLRGERKQVKTRIEKLLTQLDLLSAS